MGAFRRGILKGIINILQILQHVATTVRCLYKNDNQYELHFNQPDSTIIGSIRPKHIKILNPNNTMSYRKHGFANRSSRSI